MSVAIKLAVSKLIAVAQKAGLQPVVRKTGYVKFYAAGKTAGQCVQVWHGKDGSESSQVDLVNLSVKDEGVIEHKDLRKPNSYTSVAQQLDLSGERTEEQAMESFFQVCSAIAKGSVAGAEKGINPIAQLQAELAAAKAEIAALTPAKPAAGATAEPVLQTELTSGENGAEAQ
jgi:hypothetical protein